MVGKQLDIFQTHENENNKESQANLDKNRKRFNAKCKIVFDRLMAGEELTVLQCANDGIASLPRRIKDIREKGVEISDYWNNGVKYYFMTSDQVDINGRKFKHGKT